MNKQAILFIDGENFLFSVAKILKSKNIIRHKSEIKKISVDTLINTALKDFEISQARFYAGKIHIPKQYPELVAKSNLIAESQRRLKRSLTNEGIEFITSGHVRLQDTKINEHGKLQGIFKEKGTDVQIAIDMVSRACDKEIGTALILSSDSDMQPAVKEMRKRNVTVVYVGFENGINEGLSQTTDRTVLIRTSEVMSAWEKANPAQLELSKP
jgi:uncharacterized LabA/DUF88 family protein